MAWSKKILDPEFWRRISPGKGVTPPSVIGDLVATLGLVPPATILDVGCGDGFHAAEFANLGFKASGVDLTPDFVNEARAAFPFVAFTCADARDHLASLPANSQSLILFLSTSVFGYLPTEADDVGLLHLVRRAIEVGGRVVIDQPNHLRLRNTAPARFPISGEELTLVRSYELDGYQLTTHFEWLDNRTRVALHKESATVRLYDSNKIRELLANAGFSQVDLSADFKGGAFDEAIPSRLVAIAAK